MLLKKFERKQVGVIYHVCSPLSFMYNIDNDSITPGENSDTEFRRGQERRSISFTRNDKYIVDTIEDMPVVYQMVLDGDRISDKNHIEPFAAFMYTGKLAEQEESIFDDDGLVGLRKNKYLIGVNVIINVRRMSSATKRDCETALESLLVCNSLNLPVNVKKIDDSEFNLIPENLNGLIHYFDALAHYNQMTKNGSQLRTAIADCVEKFDKDESYDFYFYNNSAVITLASEEDFYPTNVPLVYGVIDAVEKAFNGVPCGKVLTYYDASIDSSITKTRRFDKSKIDSLIKSNKLLLVKIVVNIVLDKLTFETPNVNLFFLDENGDEHDYTVHVYPILSSN